MEQPPASSSSASQSSAELCKTYADVPVEQFNQWCTMIAGMPCESVSQAFLGWIQESPKTGFIPPPPPPPSAEFMAGRPNVELTAKGLPSFRCGRPRDINAMWLCTGHHYNRVGESLDALPSGAWYPTATCCTGSALDV